MTNGDRAMFYTFAPGMREKYSQACGSSLQNSPIYYPGDTRKEITIKGGTLEPRGDVNYESCYFIFKGDTDTWKGGSMMKIFLDSATDANVYIFKGETRADAKLMQWKSDSSENKYFTANMEDTLIVITQNVPW